MTEITEKAQVIFDNLAKKSFLNIGNFDVSYKDKAVGSAKCINEGGRLIIDITIHDDEIVEDLKSGKKKLDYDEGISLEKDGSIKFIPCKIVDVEGKP